MSEVTTTKHDDDLDAFTEALMALSIPTTTKNPKPPPPAKIVHSLPVGVTREALARILCSIEANDTNYDMRAAFVYEALALASQLGYPAGIRYDSTQETPSAWWPVVCIDLPVVGEVAWHMAAYDTPYTGYTTEVKYQRIAAYCKAVGK